MLRVACLLGSLMFAGLASPSLIANDAYQTNPVVEVAAQAYLMGPGDQVSIHVVDLEDFTDRATRVDPNGYLDLPLIGRIHAEGLSLDQVKKLIADRLTKFITDPQITINVTEYQSQPVSILGSVNNPGVHQLSGPSRLVDVISGAGGLKSDAGPRLTITRLEKWGHLPVAGAHADSSGQYETAEVPLEGLTTGANPVQNIEVRPHDVISVQRADVVYVVGEVKKAGGFTLGTHDSISLLRALSLAEGMSHDASPAKARILRAALGTKAGGSDTAAGEVSVDIRQILRGQAPDLQLHPNDVLFIPNNIPASAMRRAAEAALQIATGFVIYH